MNRIIAQIFASLVSLRHQAFALPIKTGSGSTLLCDIIFTPIRYLRLGSYPLHHGAA